MMPRVTRSEWARVLALALVFIGPDERALGTFDPSRAPYLTLVFRAGDVALYRVALP